jgi:DNA anti-recombination protein RmuC
MAEATAISLVPVTERIGAAIDALRAKSSDGIAELVSSFSDSLRDGAGVEMKAVSATLKQMAETLTTLQSRLDGSGEAFANRITAVTTELAQTAAETGRAAAAAQIEATKGFSEASAAWKDSAQAAGRQFERDAASAGAKVTAEVEKVMGAGFATLHGEVERMNSGFAVLREAYAANADGLRASANHSQDAARAFGAAAENLRTSTGPLAQSTKIIAEAVQRTETAMSVSVASLSESNAAARRLADELRTHQTALAESWRDYSARFEKVDDDLGRAFEALGKATADQIAKIISFVTEIDKSLEKTLQQLNAPLTELGSATGELSDNVEKLLKASKNPG